MSAITTTASTLNAAIWGGDVTRLTPRDSAVEPDGRGWYLHAGTRYPVRRLTGQEPVHVTIDHDGGA